MERCTPLRVEAEDEACCVEISSLRDSVRFFTDFFPALPCRAFKFPPAGSALPLPSVWLAGNMLARTRTWFSVTILDALRFAVGILSIERIKRPQVLCRSELNE
jgi:hypothetical protein